MDEISSTMTEKRGSNLTRADRHARPGNPGAALRYTDHIACQKAKTPERVYLRVPGFIFTKGRSMNALLTSREFWVTLFTWPC